MTPTQQQYGTNLHLIHQHGSSLPFTGSNAFILVAVAACFIALAIYLNHINPVRS